MLLYYVEDKAWPEFTLDQTDKHPKPTKRESCALMYDIKKRRMLIYGGFSNEWLDDLWALDVSQIVGPSYSIERIEPNMGPISGGADISVFGKGFHNEGVQYKLHFKINNNK